MFVIFFFQAEDGIRDKLVTGVQTCALPICRDAPRSASASGSSRASPTPASVRRCASRGGTGASYAISRPAARRSSRRSGARRSEEHTSELQSLAYLVCRLLLEKKKNSIRNWADATVEGCPT